MVFLLKATNRVMALWAIRQPIRLLFVVMLLDQCQEPKAALKATVIVKSLNLPWLLVHKTTNKIPTCCHSLGAMSRA